MPRKKSTVIAKLDRRNMSIRIQEMTGMSQRQADNSINAVAWAMRTWLQGLIRDIPWGTKARMIIKGFGAIEVRYEKQAKASAWRTRNGFPQRPELISIIFVPGREVTEELKRANKPIRTKYSKEYNEARERYRANNPKGTGFTRQKEGSACTEQQIENSAAERIPAITLPADTITMPNIIIDSETPPNQIDIRSADGQTLASIVNIGPAPWDQMSQAAQEAAEIEAEEREHQAQYGRSPLTEVIPLQMQIEMEQPKTILHAVKDLITAETAPHLSAEERAILTEQLEALKARKQARIIQPVKSPGPPSLPAAAPNPAPTEREPHIYNECTEHASEPEPDFAGFSYQPALPDDIQAINTLHPSSAMAFPKPNG